MLLPGDYLKPPGGVLNDAVSTLNLIECLPLLGGVSSSVMLLDACRNDVDDLRSPRQGRPDTQPSRTRHNPPRL